jgi:hypothetical protein
MRFAEIIWSCGSWGQFSAGAKDPDQQRNLDSRSSPMRRRTNRRPTDRRCGLVGGSVRAQIRDLEMPLKHLSGLEAPTNRGDGRESGEWPLGTTRATLLLQRQGKDPFAFFSHHSPSCWRGVVHQSMVQVGAHARQTIACISQTLACFVRGVGSTSCVSN